MGNAGLSLALIHKHVTCKISVSKWLLETTYPYKHVKNFWKYSEKEEIEEPNQITINIKLLSCINTYKSIYFYALQYHIQI